MEAPTRNFIVQSGAHLLTIPILCWALLIMRGIFHTHDVSGIVSTDVIR
jgi:hypothetical protein